MRIEITARLVKHDEARHVFHLSAKRGNEEHVTMVEIPAVVARETRDVVHHAIDKVVRCFKSAIDQEVGVYVRGD